MDVSWAARQQPGNTYFFNLNKFWPALETIGWTEPKSGLQLGHIIGAWELGPLGFLWARRAQPCRVPWLHKQKEKTPFLGLEKDSEGTAGVLSDIIRSVVPTVARLTAPCELILLKGVWPESRALCLSALSAQLASCGPTAPDSAGSGPTEAAPWARELAEEQRTEEQRHGMLKAQF